MQNQMILTPFFLDEPLPGLESLAASDWRINKPHLPDGETQQRLSALHKPLADFTQQSILNGKRPISIAGVSLPRLDPVYGAGGPLKAYWESEGKLNAKPDDPDAVFSG